MCNSNSNQAGDTKIIKWLHQQKLVQIELHNLWADHSQESHIWMGNK